MGGPALAIGYINRPELNRQRFITVPDELKDKLGDRLYRTGDWGYLLPNSVLEICGRCDTMVKIRGYSIEILVRFMLPIFSLSLVSKKSYKFNCLLPTISNSNSLISLKKYICRLWKQ